MSNKQKDRERVERRYSEVFKPAFDAFIKLYPLTTDDLPDELWRPVPNFADYYVSNYGRTKSFKQSKVKIIKPALNKHGYLFVGLSKEGKQKNFYVARLVAELFIPNPDLKPEVNHRDGNKLNNHVSNLEWMTHAENSQHAVDTGLYVAPLGYDVYNAALIDDADILYIRNNPDNLTRKQLAEIFNCKPATISRVQLGQAYANCGGQIRESKLHCLTPEQKAEIRRLYVKGSKEFGSYALARMFGCTSPTIWNIVNS